MKFIYSFKEKNTLRRHQQRKHGLLSGLRKSKYSVCNHISDKFKKDDESYETTVHDEIPKKQTLPLQIFKEDKNVISKFKQNYTTSTNITLQQHGIEALRTKPNLNNQKLPVKSNSATGLKTAASKNDLFDPFSSTILKLENTLCIKKEDSNKCFNRKVDAENFNTRTPSPELTINDFLRDD